MKNRETTYTYNIPQPPPPSEYEQETPEQRAHTALVNAVAGKVWMLNYLPAATLAAIDRVITDGYEQARGRN